MFFFATESSRPGISSFASVTFQRIPTPTSARHAASWGATLAKPAWTEKSRIFFLDLYSSLLWNMMGLASWKLSHDFHPELRGWSSQSSHRFQVLTTYDLRGKCWIWWVERVETSDSKVIQTCSCLEVAGVPINSWENVSRKAIDFGMVGLQENVHWSWWQWWPMAGAWLS